MKLKLALCVLAVIPALRSDVITCNAGAASVPVFDPSSTSGAVGDYTLDCTGGTPTPPLQTVPTVNFFASLTVPVLNTGGWILKDGGAKINFNHGIYDLPANTVEKSDIAWQEKQVVNGKRVLCLYTKSNHFFVTIPQDMIFFDADIRGQKDLADMLLMALTWDVPRYPVEPGTIERLKKPTN